MDKILLDNLSAQTKTNPRLRQNYDLHTSPADDSQHMLNALEPRTVMPVHRHMKTSESIAMIRGRMVMRLDDDNGTRWWCWKEELWRLRRRMGSMSR